MGDKTQQTELHRHLDVSTRISTLHELCIKQGLVEGNKTLGDFKGDVIISKPLKNLTEVLDQFSIYSKVLQTPEIIKRVAKETVEDCYQEGTRLVELRYSPSFAGGYSSLSWDEIHKAFLQGIQEATSHLKDIKAGLICIISRDRKKELVENTAEFYLQNLDTFIGVDLAGSEEGYPAKMFEPVFKEIRKKTPDCVTIHAGEGSGSQNIWDAIELLGARRIGHGIDCIDDSELQKYLRENEICLEVCPTSNYLTQASPKLENHPLPKLLRAGVPVTINTDDPSIFNTSMNKEMEICLTTLGMTQAEIERCFEFGAQYSFIH